MMKVFCLIIPNIFCCKNLPKNQTLIVYLIEEYNLFGKKKTHTLSKKIIFLFFSFIPRIHRFVYTHIIRKSWLCCLNLMYQCAKIQDKEDKDRSCEMNLNNSIGRLSKMWKPTSFIALRDFSSPPLYVHSWMKFLCYFQNFIWNLIFHYFHIYILNCGVLILGHSLE